MKKHIKLISLILLVAFLVPMLVFPASLMTEDEYEQKKNERDQLAAENEALNSQLQEINTQVSEMYAALQENTDAANSLVLREQSYSELLQSCMERYESEQELLNVTTALMDSINDEIAALEDKQKKLEESLIDTIRNLHENGSVGYVEFLLGSTTIVDFLNRYEYVTSIIEYHRNVLDEIEENNALLEERYAEFEVLSKKQQETLSLLESRRATYDAIIAECMAELTELNKESATLQEFISLKEQDLANVENKIADTLSKIEDIDSLIKEYEDESFYWPCRVSSMITSDYGYRILEGSPNMHRGVDLNSRYENTYSARAGVVITAEYSSSYGYYIVIAHSNDVQTWYAHLSKMNVKVGDVVKANQVIGVSGNSGWSTGPHLHFEIRYKGSPVNPLKCPQLGINGISSYLMVP